MKSLLLFVTLTLTHLIVLSQIDDNPYIRIRDGKQLSKEIKAENKLVQKNRKSYGKSSWKLIYPIQGNILGERFSFYRPETFEIGLNAGSKEVYQIITDTIFGENSEIISELSSITNLPFFSKNNYKISAINVKGNKYVDRVMTATLKAPTDFVYSGLRADTVIIKITKKNNNQIDFGDIKEIEGFIRQYVKIDSTKKIIPYSIFDSINFSKSKKDTVDIKLFDNKAYYQVQLARMSDLGTYPKTWGRTFNTIKDETAKVVNGRTVNNYVPSVNRNTTGQPSQPQQPQITSIQYVSNLKLDTLTLRVDEESPKRFLRRYNDADDGSLDPFFAYLSCSRINNKLCLFINISSQKKSILLEEDDTNRWHYNERYITDVNIGGKYVIKRVILSLRAIRIEDKIVISESFIQYPEDKLIIY